MQSENEESQKLKALVREKYSEIAVRSEKGEAAGCCGPAGCCEPATGEQAGDGISFDIMAESYEGLEGYQPDADLSLGCGIPIEFAGLKPGQHVLDLGSGAGNDIFVARSVVGETGRLTGLDFSEAMTRKARANAEKMGYGNVEFITGDIEEMPLESGRFDVVLSNCVLNLVPDKKTAFAGIFRVLKSGGHFSISDIVLEGTIPEPIRKAAEAYVGCVSGAMQKEEYLDIVRASGFSDVTVRKEREIIIPQDWLVRLLGEEQSKILEENHFRVLSITLNGKKS
ncbi:MAG: methyltransferase domain-containing protein [Balneolaceae bacterium]|nr:MAG: methyltransferase domain-containing protein [Balneolaceae bacterium]